MFQQALRCQQGWESHDIRLEQPVLTVLRGMSWQAPICLWCFVLEQSGSPQTFGAAPGKLFPAWSKGAAPNRALLHSRSAAPAQNRKP